MSDQPRGVALSLQQISKAFGDRIVFENLNLSVPAGEFISVVGPSGCGKSTLLRLLAGLEPPDTGRLSVVPSPRTGFVFQEAQLLPWRTVLANVCLPLELQSVPLVERTERARQALQQVGLKSDETLYPNQLSGGMKMRVSLARALVTSPDLLLLDEPFAALDELSRVQLEEELRQLWVARRMTVVFVTHSFSEAVFLSNRVLVFSAKRRGIGDSLDVGLGERNEVLRRTPQFAGLVQDCRTRFEKEQRG
jgi:NitT/TauT family transport system ATP-binding protein